MMHLRPKPAPGTPSLEITVDKNDTVLSVTRTGDRWRFKRLRPRAAHGNISRFNDEQEQEMCAMYVDSPETTLHDIAEMFGLSTAGLGRILDCYNVPKRAPGVAAGAKNRKKPGQPKQTETVKAVPLVWHGVERPPEVGAGFPVNPNAEIAAYAQDYNTRHGKTMLVEFPPPTETPKTVWLVTVTRTVTEEVVGDTLAAVDAHYQGTDARIIRIERKE